MLKLLPLPGTIRKAAIVAFALVLLLCLLAAIIWRVTAGRIEAQFKQMVIAEAYITQLRYSAAGRQAAVDYLHKFFKPDEMEAQREGVILLLTDHNYRPLAGNLTEWPSTVGDVLGERTVPIMWKGRETPVRLSHRIFEDGSHLLQGRILTEFLSARRSFFVAFSAISLPLILTVLFLGYLIRKSLLNEINDIGQAAKEIVAGNFSKRVDAHRNDDELDLLSSTINRMLDHIETQVREIETISKEIAHELCTPLAQVRARIERLMGQLPADDATATELKLALNDIDALIRTFNAILRLAQIESKSRRSELRAIQLPDVIAETVEFYQHVAEAKQIDLKASIPESLSIQADPSLVARAVANLIDNAVKHTPSGGRIEVSLEASENGGAIILVDDTGPGIPEAELPFVTRRFYRGVGSDGGRGAGLGLSIVAAIASLHGGALKLANTNHGLRAELGLQTVPTIA